MESQSDYGRRKRRQRLPMGQCISPSSASHWEERTPAPAKSACGVYFGGEFVGPPLTLPGDAPRRPTDAAARAFVATAIGPDVPHCLGGRITGNSHELERTVPAQPCCYAEASCPQTSCRFLLYTPYAFSSGSRKNRLRVSSSQAGRSVRPLNIR